MKAIDKHMIIEAVKKAKSPKQTLDGVKILLDGTTDYSEIFQACFETAWKDASRRNRSIERFEGKNSDSIWWSRHAPSEDQMKEDIRQFLHFKNKTRVLGRILSEYDRDSLKRIFDMIRSHYSESV